MDETGKEKHGKVIRKVKSGKGEKREQNFGTACTRDTTTTTTTTTPHYPRLILDPDHAFIQLISDAVTIPIQGGRGLTLITYCTMCLCSRVV
jgi:hypothetical protein